MTATSRSTIIVALQTALELISTGNGYFSDPKKVFTESIDPQSYEGDYPVIAIDGSGGEGYSEEAPVQHLQKLLGVTVYLWDHPSDPDGNIDEHANKLLLDLEKAINIDWTLGGTALRARLVRNRVLTHKGKSTVAVVLDLVIEYRTPFDTPT